MKPIFSRVCKVVSSTFALHAYELFLLLVVCIVLQYLAVDLEIALPAWRAHLNILLAPLPNDSVATQALQTAKAARVLTVHANSDVMLVVMGLGGWMALVTGRLHLLHAGLRVVVMLLIWLGVALAIHPFGWMGGFGGFASLGYWAPVIPPYVCFFSAVVLLLAGASLSRYFARQAEVAVALAPVSVAAYPLFVLLTGLSILWLLDFSARGYAKLRWIGIEQVDAVFGATALLGFAALASEGFFTRMSRWLARPRAEMVAAALLVLWCAALVVLGDRSAWGSWGLPNEFKLRAAVTSELLRLPFILASGWLLYRWVENRERTGYGFAALALCVGVVLVGQWGTRDLGPVLVLASAAVLAAGGLAAWAVARMTSWPRTVALMVGVAVSVGLGFGLQWLLYEVGGQISGTVAKRLSALLAPSQASSAYLSEIFWFIGSTPAQGHGLGSVPWCGDWASVARRTASCSGVSQQSQSDYVVVGLLGLWGFMAAWGITALTAWWLLGFVGTGTNKAQERAVAQVASVARLRDCVLTVWALITLLQLGMTVAGSFGVAPLTGVVYPLVGWGKTALLSTALFAGLGMRGVLRGSNNVGAATNAAHAEYALPLLLPSLPVIRWSTATRRVSQLAAFAGLAGLAVTLTRMGDPSFIEATAQTHQVASAKKGDTRANPWRGVPGCLFLEEYDQVWVLSNGLAAGTGGLNPTAATAQLPCAAHAENLPETNRLQTPVGTEGLRAAVNPWRAAPGASTARSLNDEARKHDSKPRSVAQGANITTTIVPSAQTRAQALALCFTGQLAECEQSEVDPSPWMYYFEGAAVRMAGLFVMDVATGAIEALGSGHTPCYARQHTGPSLGLNEGVQPKTPTDCLQLPSAPAARPHRMTNHALHTEVMPGSMIKLILALGLLQARRHADGPMINDSSLIQILRKSDSKVMLDWIFCKRSDFINCDVDAYVASAAESLGWNHYCGYSPQVLCGKRDPYLDGYANKEHWIQGGSILLAPGESEAGKPFPGHEQMTGPYQAELAKRCSARGWSLCDGEHFSAIAAAMWGQGNTLASPMAVAQMFQILAAAEQGIDSVPAPRMVTDIRTLGTVALPRAELEIKVAKPSHEIGLPEKHFIASADAEVIFKGLALTHRHGGTAHSACIKVFGSSKNCDAIDWIYGKTGTPVFRHDRMTWQERLAHCSALQTRIETAEGAVETMRKLRAQHSHCNMSPYKWYGAALKAPGQEYASKIVVAVVERNYSRVTGKVDASLDEGPNLAAVMALHYARLWKNSLLE